MFWFLCVFENSRRHNIAVAVSLKGKKNPSACSSLKWAWNVPHSFLMSALIVLKCWLT